MRGFWLWGAVALAACTSSSDDRLTGGNGPDAPNADAGADLPAGVALDAAPSALHPLTPVQYKNTVRDLLGLADADVATVTIPVDEGLPSLLTVTKLDDAATTLTSLGAHKKLVPCDVAGDGTADCAAAFFTAFGGKAFRRPLTADETAWLAGIYAAARAKFSFSDSIDVLARIILQSPQLVYVHEEGVAKDGLPAGLLQLTPYELATRMSYFLWDSMPDAALLDAAAKNQLTGDALRAQTKRMLDDPRARAKLVQFTSTWLELDGTARHVSIEEAVKDPSRYTLDNVALRQAVRRETQEFVGHVWDTGAKVSDLFLSTDAYVNGPLAQLYGVTGGPKGDAWSWVKLPDGQRAGLVTRAAFLLVYANPDIPSPIRRGSAIWRELFCTNFPPPPPAAMDVKIAGGTTDAAGKPLSIRDTVIFKTTGDPQCAGCHNKVNPAGFVFGHYDALGQWQAQESGKTPTGTAYTAVIDATGELVGSDAAGTVDGAVAFSAKLAESRQLKDCLATRFFRGAFGRDLTSNEASSVKFVQDQLAATGSIRDALAAIVETPAFQLLRKGTP